MIKVGDKCEINGKTYVVHTIEVGQAWGREVGFKGWCLYQRTRLMKALGLGEWYCWFQNLNEKKNQIFNFRGSFGPSYKKLWLEYQLCSGSDFRFKFKIRPTPWASMQIGLFFFTAYLSFPFFSFRRFIDRSKETGFYFYEWALVWDWMDNSWGDGRDRNTPWYKHFYFHIDDFFLGKVEVLEQEITSTEDVYFKLGDHEFKMDSIKWIKRRSFRRHIPYTLFHREWYSAQMEIKDPPMRSGKGENSWDCGDDGSYGLYCMWDGDKPSWNNHEVITRQAVDKYVDNVLKDTKRYGGSSGERGIKKDSVYQYIGRKPNFREFGAGRGDDFPNEAGSNVNSAFLMDDGSVKIIPTPEANACEKQV